MVWIEIEVKMSLIEKYDLVKTNYSYHIVFVKSGNFWYTFKKDTIICKYVFGYSLKNKRVCFPNSVLNKNLCKLRKLNISYVVVYELSNIIVVDNTNNSYTFYFEKYYSLYINEVKYNKLIDLINDRIVDSSIEDIYNLIYKY